MPGDREPLRYYDREDDFEDALVGEDLGGHDEFGFERFGWCQTDP